VKNINTNDQRVYLSVQNAEGQMVTSSASLDGNPAAYRQIAISGDYQTMPFYFEIYISSENNEKIILSSGYIGGQS
jgi:hypothetical protein